MDWQSQLMRTTEAAFSQLPALEAQAGEQMLRKKQTEDARKGSGYDEIARDIMKDLEKINSKEEYSQVFGALVSQPEIQEIFHNSRYDFKSFRAKWNPEIRFGNVELRQKAKEEEQLRTLVSQTRANESPEMRNFIESSAKLEAHRARMLDMVHIMDLDTNQVSDPMSRREATERMKSHKAGRARILSTKEYQEPVFVHNPNTGEYEEAVYGQLEDLKRNEFEGREMRVLTKQEYMKQQIVDSWLEQTGMQISLYGHMLTRDLAAIRPQLLRLAPGPQRSRELARLLEGNMLSTGRTKKTSAEELKNDLLDSYIKIPSEMRGMKVYDPTNKKFIGITEYRNRMISLYEKWKEGIKFRTEREQLNKNEVYRDPKKLME